MKMKTIGLGRYTSKILLCRSDTGSYCFSYSFGKYNKFSSLKIRFVFFRFKQVLMGIFLPEKSREISVISLELRTKHRRKV